MPDRPAEPPLAGGDQVTPGINAVNELVAALNAHDIDRAVALFAEHCHNHGRPASPETMRAVFLAQRSAIPDLHHEVQALYQDGDTVITRSMLSGTHLGDVGGGLATRLFNGALHGLPAAGRRFRIQAIHVWETRDGRIVGHWACRDDLGLRTQLGGDQAVAEDG